MKIVTKSQLETHKSLEKIPEIILMVTRNYLKYHWCYGPDLDQMDISIKRTKEDIRKLALKDIEKIDPNLDIKFYKPKRNKPLFKIFLKTEIQPKKQNSISSLIKKFLKKITF